MEKHSIIKIENEIEPLKDCELTSTGLVIKKGLPFEKWEKIGGFLEKMNKAMGWWWGDWLNYGEREYGEMYSQALKESPYTLRTLQTLKAVCDRVKSTIRIVNLPFAFHQLVAYLNPTDQKKWLQKATEGNWTLREMKSAIRENKQKNIPLPEGKYEIIYSDPAWEYPSEQHAKAGEPTTGGSETHYNRVMSDEKLCQLKIQDIAADNCLLFMWTTGPKMESAIEVGNAWGFQYSTVGFVWYKELPNPGTYTMSECEYCLIFRKGNIPQPRGDRNIRQFLSERRTEHSKKPTEIRKRIELMFPSQKKIELFARGKALKNWDFWGDESYAN